MQLPAISKISVGPCMRLELAGLEARMREQGEATDFSALQKMDELFTTVARPSTTSSTGASAGGTDVQ